MEAAALLTKAEKLAPARADVLLLLAQVSAQLEFYHDAAASYDRYLKLKPADEVARRERAFRAGKRWPVQARIAGARRIRAQASARRRGIL